MWISRYAASTLLDFSHRFPCVWLTGPRQTGKTSLLRHTFGNASFVSFDEPAVAYEAETRPHDFLNRYLEPIILDEVQYVPSLFRYLKARIDARRMPGRFLMTGSQHYAMMQHTSESLAGRVGVIALHTLSYSEARTVDPKLSFEDYIVRGGYPELYAQSFEHVGDWYSAYVASYLQRDVRSLRQVGDLRDFDRFLRATALRSGQLLSYSDLARDVGIVPNTAKHWISVLAASGQIALVEPYHRNAGKRLVKSPKLYFLDTGLLLYLMGITSLGQVLQSPLLGAIWETAVWGHMVRSLDSLRVRSPIWFYRTSTGDEIDFLIEIGGRFIAIKAKANESPSERDTKGFRAFQKHYGVRSIQASYLVCRTPRPYDLPDGTHVVSVKTFLSRLKEEFS